MTAGLEILQQGAVVRADIDDEALTVERDYLGAFAVKIGKVVAQDSRRAAKIGITVREQDFGRDFEADLDMPAAATAQHLQRVGRLLGRHAANLRHGVYGRDIAKEQH